jgi:uncharacterized coiled-coil DUF342 family protein
MEAFLSTIAPEIKTDFEQLKDKCENVSENVDAINDLRKEISERLGSFKESIDEAVAERVQGGSFRGLDSLTTNHLLIHMYSGLRDHLKKPKVALDSDEELAKVEAQIAKLQLKKEVIKQKIVLKTKPVVVVAPVIKKERKKRVKKEVVA